MCLDSRWKYFPSCLMVRILSGLMYSSSSLFSVMASSAHEPSHNLDSSQLRFLEGALGVASKLANSLVQHAQILVSLYISFVMFDRRIEPNCLESRFLPARDNVPAKPSARQMI